MTARRQLPDRRGSLTITFRFENHDYLATASRFPDGRLGEIFLHVGKLGSALQSSADDAAILASLCLQHGIAPDVIAHSVRGPVSIALAEFSDGEQWAGA
jgi:hypothetical protein